MYENSSKMNKYFFSGDVTNPGFFCIIGVPRDNTHGRKAERQRPEGARATQGHAAQPPNRQRQRQRPRRDRTGTVFPGISPPVERAGEQRLVCGDAWREELMPPRLDAGKKYVERTLLDALNAACTGLTYADSYALTLPTTPLYMDLQPGGSLSVCAEPGGTALG